MGVGWFALGLFGTAWATGWLVKQLRTDRNDRRQRLRDWIDAEDDEEE